MDIDALQRVILSIAEARSVDQTLGFIVSGIAQDSDIALVRVWLIEDDLQCPVCAPEEHKKQVALHLRGSAGHSRLGRSTSQTGGRFHRIPMGERKIGQIAQSGAPMLIPEVQGNEAWIADPDWIRAEGIRSFAGQPLVFRAETLGVLAVFSRSLLSDEDFRWLRTFADHAAVAIANARAFDELGRLRARLEAENDYLHEEIRGAHAFGNIVGQSAALRKVLEQVALVAETNATVLVEGESGTGKELIARAIHERSPRAGKPFVRLNCGAIPEGLFESELFGHVRGAFTGAIKDRIGRFELANGGTLFLDEIGELPLGLQTKLLRVLQEKQYERVGEAQTRDVDVRLIAATNRDLKKEAAAGHFREDLFYRLSVFPIEVPPLRERKEDIKPLALEFLKRSGTRLKTELPRLSREGLRELEGYDWPGNIRELENVIERAAILSRTTGRLKFALTTGGREMRPGKETRATVHRPERVLTRSELVSQERENIIAALRQSGGKIFGKGGAAEILGMRPTTLASRLKALGLKKSFTFS